MVTLRDFLGGAKDFLHEDISDETLEQADGLEAPDTYDVGKPAWRLMQDGAGDFSDYGVAPLAELVSRSFTNVG